MTSRTSLWVLVWILPLLPSCRSTQTATKSTSKATSRDSATTVAETGMASIYTDKRTASGERYSATAMAAAHRRLPLGSQAKITNLRNGKTCVVRINDRGPYVKGRILDLTPTAASALGLGYRQGLTNVKVEKL
jgi:rare lipoprotein A